MLVAGELSEAGRAQWLVEIRSKEATRNQEQPLAWAQGPERETLPRCRKDNGTGRNPDPA